MGKVVIVGAGVSGLATAFHLRRLARARGLNLHAVVLEEQARPGGRLWTERTDGFQIEYGANGFLDSKRSTVELCHDLELTDELIAARPESRHRFIFWCNRLHPLPTGPVELMRSRLLSFRGKLRLLAEAFVRRHRWTSDESVFDFACRRIGCEAAEVLVDAIVTGIYAGDPVVLSARAAFPRMVELEERYGSLIRAMRRVRRLRQAEAAAAPSRSSAARGPLPSSVPAHPTPGGTLWSLRHGMGQLIERLAEACDAERVQGVRVTRITQADSGGWTVQGEGTDRWQADAVVLACPSFVQAQILEPLDAQLAQLVAEIPYNSVTVVALGFRAPDLPAPLDGFGYLSPQRTQRNVLGVLWSSSIFEHRAPPGLALLQSMCGGWNRPDIVTWNDDRIVRAVLAELHETMQIAATPIVVRVVRWPQAIPQYQIGHLQRVSAIEARRRRFPRLYLTGNSFRGVSVNDCTDEAARCAAEIVDQLAGPPSHSRA